MDVTLLCEDNFDGMMSAIYEGWIRMNRGDEIHIRPGNIYEYSFLTEYIYIETDFDRAQKVTNSIRKKISLEAYMLVYRTCMHYDEERVDAVMDFLKLGYKVGARVTKDFGNPVVMRMIEYNRKVGNESHLYKGFVRFKEGKGKILLAAIAPKCDILSLISNHFSNRFPLENWVIYDEVRKKALVHVKGSKAFMVKGSNVEERIGDMNIDDSYEELWKVFFDTIGITERENPGCQNNHIPKWYREHMSEFK